MGALRSRPFGESNDPQELPRQENNSIDPVMQRIGELWLQAEAETPFPTSLSETTEEKNQLLRIQHEVNRSCRREALARNRVWERKLYGSHLEWGPSTTKKCSTVCFSCRELCTIKAIRYVSPQYEPSATHVDFVLYETAPPYVLHRPTETAADELSWVLQQNCGVWPVGLVGTLPFACYQMRLLYTPPWQGWTRVCAYRLRRPTVTDRGKTTKTSGMGGTNATYNSPRSCFRNARGAGQSYC